MKKEFIEKVIRLCSVDTDKYRYVAREYPDRLEVQRLPLSALDTTAALDGWETVEVVK